MFKKVLVTAVAASFAASFLLGAADKSAVDSVSVEPTVKTVASDVSNDLTKGLTSLLAHKLSINVNKVSRSPLPGLFEVVADEGIFYVNKDATYLIQGALYELANGGVKDLTEETMASMRLDALKEYEKDLIVYPAKNEKYSITVFTDINCGYCRKLHNEMQEYNDLGITVKYLAFPRSGTNSETYRDMVSIWCADDKVAAMNDAKKGRSIDSETCSNTVEEQYMLGRKLGVNGTPALVLENGSMQPGYLPASRLIQLLEQAGK